jgi:hypothetical protein
VFGYKSCHCFQTTFNFFFASSFQSIIARHQAHLGSVFSSIDPHPTTAFHPTATSTQVNGKSFFCDWTMHLK